MSQDSRQPAGSSTPKSSRRLIENWLPVNAVSAESIRERNAASALPPINWLHVWWSRKPLVASRATVAAALLDADASPERFYSVIGTHPGVADEQHRLERAKITGERLKVAYKMPRAFTHNISAAECQWMQENLAVVDPVVLDLTAGGGSIPFETGRLGIRSIANELNPVAALILRATCEWPQQYGEKLLKDYRQISAKYLARVRELFADNAVYPPELQNAPPKNSTVRLHKYVWAYLWSRTVRCPDCRNIIPLSVHWRLHSSGQGIRLLPDADRGVCDFAVVDKAIDQSKGTVVRGKAICPYPGCGATTPAGYITAEARATRLGHQLYCVILKNQWQKADGQGGWVNIRRPKDQKHVPPREFRAIQPQDDNSVHIATLLDFHKTRWDDENILPNEPVPPTGNKTDTLQQYGMTSWVTMFSPRQQLAHGYCVQAFRELVDADENAGRLDDLRRATWTYIGLAFDKVVNRNCLRSFWDPNTNKVAHTFATHDFGMKWSYAEMAVAIESLGLEWALVEMGDCIAKLTAMVGYTPSNGNGKSSDEAMFDGLETLGDSAIAPATQVINGDARMLERDDDSVDAIVFDPPYHNNVNYAELSDFFYVWLKRTAGYVLNDGLFDEHLTDKVNEAIASPSRFKQQAQSASRKGRDKVSATALATADYEAKMAEIFAECRRVRGPDGIMVVMFTHKSNDAWNALTIGLIESGFNITRTWPIKTEAELSLHIRNRAAARSTILLVCRLAGERQPKSWSVVARDIATAVQKDVERLQTYDLSAVDIYLAAYGPALQVISENWGTKRETANPERPEDPFGVTPMDALEVARREVIDFRARELTDGNRNNVADPLTWFYILSQDGAGSTTMPFDEANLFARALGVDLGSSHARRIVINKSGKVTLKAATERMAEGIISPQRPATNPLDQVHTAIAIADRQNAEAARQWLEFNGHRWQDGEFRTTFETLRKIRKPGHPDESGSLALQKLLYEAERLEQEQLFGTEHIPK